MNFVGDDKKFVINSKSPQFLKVIQKEKNNNIKIDIDGIEEVWPNQIEHQIMKR